MARGCVSSGELSSSADVYTGAALLWGVNILSDKTNDPKIIITDGNGGTVIYERELDVSLEGFERYDPFPKGIEVMTSIYLTISGTGAKCVIHYEPR